jgi:23S rRNA pseudouridine2604 synthase
MCEYYDYQVTKLERIRIMNVALKGLALGDWRDLTDAELTGLFQSLAHSSSENKAPQKPGPRKPGPAKPGPKKPGPEKSASAKPGAPRAAAHPPRKPGPGGSTTRPSRTRRGR